MINIHIEPKHTVAHIAVTGKREEHLAWFGSESGKLTDDELNHKSKASETRCPLGTTGHTARFTILFELN